MLHYLVNTVTYSGPNGLPQKVLPGTGVDSSDVRFALLLAAGAVLFPGSYPTVAQAALRCSQARRVAADERQLEAIMQGALNAITAQGDAAGEPMTLTTGSPSVVAGRVLVPNSGDATVRLADAAGLAMLALDALPVGVSLAAGAGGGVVPVASTGTLPSSVTGLGEGLARPVGLSSDGSGRLARSIDWTSCVPGFYLGDVDVDGEFTFSPRLTARVTSYQKMVWLQDTWEIDPVNGDNRNEGTLGKPIKTWLEQYARVGRHEIDGDMVDDTPKVKVYLRGSLLSTDRCIIDLVVRSRLAFPGNAQIPYQVEGTPTVLASGVVSNVRAFDQAGNVPWGMGANISLASHVAAGRMVRKTTGSPAFPTAWWLAKNEDGTVFRTSQPTHFDAFDIVNGYNDGLYVNGDTFEVVDLPQIGSHDIQLGASGSTFDVIFNKVRFGGLGLKFRGNATFTECAFDNFAHYGEYMTLTNCQLNGFVAPSRGTYTYFTFGLFLDTFRIWQGQPTFQNYVVFQGGQVFDSDGGVCFHSHTRGFACYDQIGDGFMVGPGDSMYFAGCIGGFGNSGYGVNVRRGGRVVVGGLGATTGRFFRVTGALGDMSVGGRTSGPAISASNPYGLGADIPYTHDNFNLPLLSGGFGQNIVCPTAPGTGIIYEYT